MDIMLILQIIVLLGAIFLGVRLGGIGIGYAGGAGVLILGLCLGMKPGNIPWDVILIIASVIMMFISANTLEYVLGLFNRRKMVLIISERGEEVCEAILAKERFGVTPKDYRKVSE